MSQPQTTEQTPISLVDQLRNEYPRLFVLLDVIEQGLELAFSQENGDHE